jgi:hypothetical protein
MPKHAEKNRLAEHLKRELAEAQGKPRAKVGEGRNADREGEAPAEPLRMRDSSVLDRASAGGSLRAAGSAGASPSQGAPAHDAPSRSASRGISFNEDLVLAILAGRKTQTRRPVRGDASACAYAVPGEIVFIREKWARRADGSFALASLDADERPKPRWQAGRFMPREAARHFLHVTSVQLVPLTELSVDDARAEGAPTDTADPVAWFRSAWGAIYRETDHAWERSPLVWVIGFELVRSS